MERLTERKLWLLLLLLAAVGSFFAGGAFFADAYCHKLVDLLLWVLVGFSFFGLSLYAIVTWNDSPQAKLVSILAMVALPLLLVGVSTPVLSSIGSVASTFCPPDECAAIPDAEALLDKGGTGDVASAVFLMCTCVQKTTNAACAIECSKVLARGRLAQGITALREGRCSQANDALTEAGNLADKFMPGSDLAKAVADRKVDYESDCVTPTSTPIPTLTWTPSPTWTFSPTPKTPVPTSTPTHTHTPSPTNTPTPTYTPVPFEVEVMRKRLVDGTVSLDFRVWQRNKKQAGLAQSEFVFTSGGKPVTVQRFEERKADDPVCVVAAVDNSGSIKPGLAQIQEAIKAMNSVRKPDDELGMVVFAERDKVNVVLEPSKAPANPAAVTGAGQYTALWDGMLAALEQTDKCHVASKYIILLTDGRDNHSRKLEGDSTERAHAIAEMAQRRGVGVCTIGVQSKDLEVGPLERVAYGCGYYSAATFDEVAGLFQRIFGYVRDYYRVELPADRLTGDPKRVEMKVHNTTEVSVEFDD